MRRPIVGWGFPALVLVLAVALTGCGEDVPEESASVVSSPTPDPTPTPIPALTLDDLGSAPVPSACEHPEGVLVDGFLPGIEPASGFVALAASAAAEYGTGDPESYVAINPTPREDDIGAVAVVTCTRGGVAWPDHLVVYSPDLEILAAFDAAASGGGPNDQLSALEWAGDNTVRFDWSVLRADEPLGGSRLSSEETVSMVKSEVSLSLPDIVEVRQAAEAFLSAVDERNWVVATDLSTEKAVAGLQGREGMFTVRWTDEDTLTCVEAGHPGLHHEYLENLSRSGATFMCEYVYPGGSLPNNSGTINLIPLLGEGVEVGSWHVNGIIIPSEIEYFHF